MRREIWDRTSDHMRRRLTNVSRYGSVLLCVFAATSVGCGKKSTTASTPHAPPAHAEPPATQHATGNATPDAASSSAQPGALTIDRALSGPSAAEQIAGYIFNVPVPAGNYYFAKRVLYTFPHAWEEGLSEADRERAVWENLILHYESFRRNITVSDDELEKRIDSVLKNQQQSFTRANDPSAYTKWVTDTLHEDNELFENQMRYLLQIDKVKDQVRESLPVTVTEEEMQQAFLDQQNHIGGEMVTFDSKEDAKTFYEQVKAPDTWEQMKAKGDHNVRPVSLMTLQAYMDLWGIPREQMYAFHAMPLGSIGPPMPFGKQWCVYRLLDKRTGELQEFPSQRDEYYKQLRIKKQYEALKTWIENLKASAHLKILPLPKS